VESPVFGYESNFTNYLGEKTFNSTGHVIGARTVRSIWLTKFNPHDIEPTRKLTGFEIDLVDAFTMDYEAELIKLLRAWAKETEEKKNGHKLYINVARSFIDEASGPIEFDINRMMFGYVLMFIYTTFTLGKLNVVEHKFFLALSGILSVFFGFVVSIGITMAAGLLVCDSPIVKHYI
jgi:Niemann-Pick C1 protein